MYLQHHGIKGQKWGIRRYQNKDGTLTDAGSKRYGHNLTRRNENRLYSKYKSKGLTDSEALHAARKTAQIEKWVAIGIGAAAVTTAVVVGRKYVSGKAASTPMSALGGATSGKASNINDKIFNQAKEFSKAASDRAKTSKRAASMVDDFTETLLKH